MYTKEITLDLKNILNTELIRSNQKFIIKQNKFYTLLSELICSDKNLLPHNMIHIEHQENKN